MAIRYPRGGNGAYTGSGWTDSDISIYKHREGNDLTIITYGILVNNVLAAADILADQGIEVTVLRLMRINPIDADDIISQLAPTKEVFVAEEIAGNCGIRAHISCMLTERDPAYHVHGIDLGNRYVQHGAIDKLYDYYGLSPEKLAQSILEVHHSEN